MKLLAFCMVLNMSFITMPMEREVVVENEAGCFDSLTQFFTDIATYANLKKRELRGSVYVAQATFGTELDDEIIRTENGKLWKYESDNDISKSIRQATKSEIKKAKNILNVRPDYEYAQGRSQGNGGSISIKLPNGCFASYYSGGSKCTGWEIRKIESN